MTNRTTESTVRAILLDTSTDADDIGKRYGVSPQTVRLYKTGQLKKAVDTGCAMVAEGLSPLTWTTGASGKRGKFTTLEIAEIRASKKPSSKLAEDYGCSPSMIRMIKTGKSYGGV